MQKRWLKIAAAVAALVLVLVALAPFLVNADTFRPMLQTQLSAALGRKVTLGHLSFSLLSGSLVAQNISIADDPAFSADPFLQAKSLHIGVETVPLLLHHRLRVTRFAVDAPSIQLIHAQSGAPNGAQPGTWNFSSIARSSAASAVPASPQPSAIPGLTIAEFSITNGSATVSSTPAIGKPFVYSKLDLTLKQFSFANSFPFELSASLPGDGSLRLSGTAGPLSRKDASDTPFHATLQLKHFDPVAAGVVDPSQGISMLADTDAQLASDGTNLASTGKIRAARLQLARTGSPAPQPVDIDYAITDNLDARTGQLSDLSVHTGNVAVHVAGSYRLTAQAILLDLRLAATNLPIDQLKQLLPVVGVRLPTGSSLSGGTLTANLAITGPATAATVSGPVAISNTQLTDFDLGSRIQGLNPFGNTSGNTRIQTLQANLNASPQSTQLTGIYAAVPQIGTATGSGVVSPAGALDFKLVAKLSASSGVGAVVTQASSAFGGFLGKVLHNTVSNGIPLTITGTTANPSIHANVGAMLK
ncbi:MAG: AsmA family protein [Acidobacteriaceae bacterium]